MLDFRVSALFQFILFLLPALIFFLAGLVSLIFALAEKEKLAAYRSFWAMLIMPCPYLILYYLPLENKTTIIYILDGLLLLTGFILFFPIYRKKFGDKSVPSKRFDERDVIFKRRDMTPDRAEEYYREHPEKLEPDSKAAAKPGLCSPNSHYYDLLQFTAVDANFAATEHLVEMAKNMKPAPEPQDISPEKLTQFTSKYLSAIGAFDSGICRLESYHLYSKSGKDDDYGSVIEKKHRHAVAIAVEMDKDMMDYSPAGPALMETSHQYFKVAGIAGRLAEFYNRLGYESKAHIDAYYEVICPLVGRDAGLGEIGRMGLLMHPKIGPRHRLAVVTTNAPLVPNEYRPDDSVIDFCEMCKKCADVCPSDAISRESIKNSESGELRQAIDSDKCYEFWCEAGTDCGRCIKACPYSHPDNLFHNSIRKAIQYFPVFRKFAYKMDDYFYGRIPPIKEIEKYMKKNS